MRQGELHKYCGRAHAWRHNGFVRKATYLDATELVEEPKDKEVVDVGPVTSSL
jgi:hypothetical protein